MSILTFLVLLFIFCVIFFIVRSAVGVYKLSMQSPLPAGKFPAFSIGMLSISLVLLIVGTLISLQFSDALGGAIASIGGVFGMIESRVRHKRESLKEAEKEPA